MPIFSNLNDLENYIKKQVKDVLSDEVATEVKSTMQKAIENTVYDAYTPQIYERRGVNGGLADSNNIVVLPLKDGIWVKNVAPVNDEYGAQITAGNLDQIIASGEGYTYSGYKKDYEKPRDFYKETQEMLQQDKIVEKALKDGLRKRGINCD